MALEEKGKRKENFPLEERTSRSSPRAQSLEWALEQNSEAKAGPWGKLMSGVRPGEVSVAREGLGEEAAAGLYRVC